LVRSAIRSTQQRNKVSIGQAVGTASISAWLRTAAVRAAGQRFKRRAAQIETAREVANRWQHAARCIGHKIAAPDCTGPPGSFATERWECRGGIVRRQKNYPRGNRALEGPATKCVSKTRRPLDGLGVTVFIVKSGPFFRGGYY
jgi:hypothetical protein